MNEKYEQYDDYTINILMNEPWEISDKPYKLHAAYALSCLFEVAAPEDDDEQSIGRDVIWGQRVPKKILDNLVVDIAESFNDAARNFKQVDIWERRYSIRKLNAFDAKRLIKIFDFTHLKNHISFRVTGSALSFNKAVCKIFKSRGVCVNGGKR